MSVIVITLKSGKVIECTSYKEVDDLIWFITLDGHSYRIAKDDVANIKSKVEVLKNANC